MIEAHDSLGAEVERVAEATTTQGHRHAHRGPQLVFARELDDAIVGAAAVGEGRAQLEAEARRQREVREAYRGAQAGRDEDAGEVGAQGPADKFCGVAAVEGEAGEQAEVALIAQAPLPRARSEGGQRAVDLVDKRRRRHPRRRRRWRWFQGGQRRRGQGRAAVDVGGVEVDKYYRSSNVTI